MSELSVIYLMLTENCNYHCSFCIRNNIINNQNEVSSNLLIDALHILSQEYPNATIVLTGGEPTLYPAFSDILQEAMNCFKSVQIASNGSFGEKTRSVILPCLKKNLFLQMSLDGTESTHNSIRGVGAYQRVINNLEQLEPAFNRIRIAVTATPENYEDIKMLALRLNDYKFHSLKVTSVIDHGENFFNTFSPEKWNKFVDELLINCHYRVYVQKILDFDLFDKYISDTTITPKFTNCGRASRQFYVTPQLNVLPCTCIQDTVGNLLTDNISDIKKKLAEYSHISVDPESVCYSCKYLRLCNGGCPGFSLHYFGKPNMGDVRCPFVKEYFLKKH